MSRAVSRRGATVISARKPVAAKPVAITITARSLAPVLPPVQVVEQPPQVVMKAPEPQIVKAKEPSFVAEARENISDAELSSLILKKYISCIVKKGKIKRLVNMNSKTHEFFCNGGLNGKANSVVLLGDYLYYGGNFSGTNDGKYKFSNFAKYNYIEDVWYDVPGTDGY